jgi:hypothetical protein
MTENIDKMITGRQFQSTSEALEIAKKALSVRDYELYEQARVFYYRETSQMEFIEMLKGVVIETAGKGDLDMCLYCIEDVYSYMPVTAARTYEISCFAEAKLIIDTLVYSKIVNIADEGSAANLLATKALEYIYENGSFEESLAIIKGANPRLYEIVTSPFGITDDGRKVIDVEDCAKALGIPVDELIEMSPDSAFLPEGTKVNLIH